MQKNDIEIFQDLNLRTTSASASIRNCILDQVKGPWRHDVKREADVKNNALGNDDVIVLVRDSFEDVDESGLVLWQENDGYRVANIVPRNVGELGIEKYNRILQDFVDQVATPAAVLGNFKVDLSPHWQGLNDWMDTNAIQALQRFSNMANKSTGASHPKDQERWFEFLIQAHRASKRIDSELLVRWLHEIENWPEDTAHELAIDYEFALGLLGQYDLS